MSRSENVATCETCEAPASVQVLDTHDGITRFCCSEHKILGPVGERSPRFVIKRWRFPPDSDLSRWLAAPGNSPEHLALRWEMCDQPLLGGDGAIRYYLSILTKSDQFVAWNDEFEDNVKRFLVEKTNGEASQFPIDSHSMQSIVGFFRITLERLEGKYNTHPPRKDDRAIELLLSHPGWTDEQIAAQVPTTVKQLSRSTSFKHLRMAQNRVTKSLSRANNGQPQSPPSADQLR